MILQVNGKETEVKDNITIQGLLEELNIQPGRVAVEVNMQIVKRVNHPEHILKNGDVVEIVNFVGGG